MPSVIDFCQRTIKGSLFFKTVLWAAMFAVFEGAGLGMLLPILVFIESGNSASAKIPYVGDLLQFAGAHGMPINIVVLLVAALVPLILRQVAQYRRDRLIAGVQYQASADSRFTQVETYFNADLRFLVESKHADLVSRLVTDSDRIGAAAAAVLIFSSASVLLVVYIALLLTISWRLTIIALPIFAVSGMLYRGLFAKGRALGQELIKARADFFFGLGEGLNAMRLIKLRGSEQSIFGDFSRIITSIFKVHNEIEKNRLTLELTAQPLMLLGVFFVLYYAVDHLEMHLANLGIFLFVTLRCPPQLIQLNAQWLQISNCMAALNVVESTLARARSATHPHMGTRPFTGFSDAITFQDVQFHYPGTPDQPVLTGLNLRVRKGEFAALVGRSGAGKSTALDLLPRLHEPTGGCITIDGIALPEFDVQTLRRSIGFVTQESVIIHDSVRANLAFGLGREVTEAELWDALARAHADAFVRKLDQGLDTVIGDRGVRLSGGQKQRVTLARTLLQKPSILLLDEPTSALDTVSETAIKSSLAELKGDLTILMVAHRLTTIRDADTIIVLDGGKATAQGSLDAVLQQSETFRQLYDVEDVD